MQLKKFLLFSGVFCFLFSANFIDGMKGKVPMPRSSSFNELNVFTDDKKHYFSSYSPYKKMNIDEYLETVKKVLDANGWQDELASIDYFSSDGKHHYK